MISNWSMNLDFARHRHNADLAKAERFRLVRRSRRAKRRVGAEEQASIMPLSAPTPGAVVSLPVRPAPGGVDRPDRLAS